MESIRQLYKIGKGPSSSHTMGPHNAALRFRGMYPDALRIRVTLYGSLAATGKGHLTDEAILSGLETIPTELVWKPETTLPRHPNGMAFEALDGNGGLMGEWTVYSIGGGALADENDVYRPEKVYGLDTMNAILQHCDTHAQVLWEFVYAREGEAIRDYLLTVWGVMKAAVRAGIDTEGRLPGGLGLRRKAASYFIKARSLRGSLKRRCLVFAYALAVSEHNAGGGEVVTAPTCGSCGVLPAVLYLIQTNHRFSDEKIARALATAGLIGNLVKHNASISGAEVGCQGEIGTACAMAAGAAMQLFGGTPQQIEYAAEMGLEHHLGLTCDPIGGLVQVPCIERNAFAASRALDANSFAMLSDGRHRVSFDQVVRTMKQTGHDLPSLYKETSGGGLAVHAEG